MIPESSRPAVPPIETAAGREPDESRMAPVWAFVFLLVAAAFLVGLALLAQWLGLVW